MRIPALLLGALLMLAQASRGGEYVYEDHNFAFEWPSGEGWVPVEAPVRADRNLLGQTLVNESLGRTVSVVVLRTAPDASMDDPEYVRGVKTGLRRRQPDMEITSAAVEPFAGVRALKLWANIPNEDGVLRAYTIQFAIRGKHYLLAANAQPPGDGTDAELEQALASFRFLNPPPAAPAVKEDDGFASRLGYLIGYYGIPLVILLAFVHRLRYNAAQRRKDEKERTYP